MSYLYSYESLISNLPQEPTLKISSCQQDSRQDPDSPIFAVLILHFSTRIKFLTIVLFYLACIGAFSLGTVCAWSSPVLPYLVDCDLSPNCTEGGEKKCCDLTISLSSEESSWIGSIFPLGALVSGQVSIYIARGPFINYIKQNFRTSSSPAKCFFFFMLLPATVDLYCIRLSCHMFHIYYCRGRNMLYFLTMSFL